EVLVERALAIFSERGPAAILDMGTGSGCILISLLSRFLDSYGVGLDLSYGALLTARRNAARNGVLNRSGFICGSWGDSLGKKFDLVVSNPPYIANHVIPSLQEEVRDHDPILGLDGGADGLQAYRDIFSGLNSLLAPDGKALLEIGFDQGDSVMRLAEDSGFCVEGVWPDYAGLPRVVEISSGDK
ncbi:MAG: peptide chain release factor N(5)-glutamine methyltransferase, partial [Planctomycetaceae bacterium]|nr:peptide chain release factor N(5)-glutamine methyltransferase [Planctomycetaceae bacterium]